MDLAFGVRKAIPGTWMGRLESRYVCSLELDRVNRRASNGFRWIDGRIGMNG